jgi:hypothetical protein
MCGVVLFDGVLGVLVLGLVVLGVADVPLGAALPLPLAVSLERGAAEAPAMPEAAPPAASAPATIVAPSIFETFMFTTSWGCLGGCQPSSPPRLRRPEGPSKHLRRGA